MTKTLRSLIAASFLLCSLTTPAQEKGYWRAANSQAQSITGDVSLSAEKITINFVSFAMAPIRTLTPAEMSALFDLDANTAATGNLYRISIPGSRKFLHKNGLCGGDDTDWMVAYAAGHSLQLAFFSSQTPPVITLDSIANSSDFCGAFSYIK